AANLKGANLKGATTAGTKFEGAKLCNTIMPDGSVNDSGC
ncbi:MAG: pentapeptide repeat-containing protein, partial [Betaproteobacteria bacterium]|nr:pentapeptide repeat-containing protein [Betaproteobacteria bacterium]